MMFGIDLSPAAACLFASLLWAPLVYAVAAGVDRGRGKTMSELVWLCALAAAALPTLAAPALDAAGLSLRPAPVIELAPIAGPRAPATAETIAAAAATVAAPALTPATLIHAAGLLYVYGVILAALLWLARAGMFAMEMRKARAIAHPALHEALDAWRGRLGVEAPIALRKSGAVSSVCVHGFLKPVIVIPEDLDARLTFDDLVMMIAHEVAHVRRGDAALFAACAAARVVFWFNPFVGRIAGRAELAAEQGADALVLARGADRRAYAACFIEGLRFAAERAHGAHIGVRIPVPSFTPFDRKSRRDRLDAILSGRPGRVSAPSKYLVAGAAFAAGAAAFAQAAIAVAPEPRIVRKEAAFVSAPLAVNGEKGSELRAPADGVIVEATDVYKGKPGLGKVVVIKHGEGRTTRFSRLKSYSVKKGDRVAKGDVVGVAGDQVDVFMRDDANGRSRAGVAALAPTAPLAPPSPIAPSAPIPPSDDLDTELDGGFEPWDAPEPPAPAEPAEPAEPAAPPARGFSRWFMKNPNGGFAFHFKEGDRDIVIDDDSFAFAFGEPMSDDDRKRLDASMKKMREDLKHARARHADAMSRLSKDFKSFRFDGKELAEIRARAMADASAFADEWNREAAEAMREAERARDDAMDALDDDWSSSWSHDEEDCDQACRADAIEDAAREREEAFEEARREREEALHEAEIERAEAEAEREQALAEAQAEREEARAEAEAAREEALAEAEAEREEARAEAEAAREDALAERVAIEEEIRERAEAIAEAERGLAEERREIERLRLELRNSDED